ncbi:hypothetical protein [Croceicoccus naphthovorans]|uniref:Uncharacterized protein n=1 Tax=Croceicoccus naphthovorans TaxID=1348774 RepID=A0A0G3XG57_9SPHN|nr:hypothetical protein [Croceicoccus naphthovorans]AKM09606.1 hypothetical protein AB433_05830 [Croceicoccus naphthovorans]MBB3989619.1 hypothetical protein [Croceicoccus naphthovorans]
MLRYGSVLLAGLSLFLFRPAEVVALTATRLPDRGNTDAVAQPDTHRDADTNKRRDHVIAASP